MKQKNTRSVKITDKQKNKRKLDYGFLALVFVCSVIMSGLVSYVLSTPDLSIVSTSISGVNLSNSQMVQEAANRARGTNILLLRKSVINQQMASIPEVKDICIKRIFPSSIEVNVTEWKPDACIKSPNGVFLARLDGTVFHKSSKIRSGIPLIITPESAKVGKKLSGEKSGFAFQALKLSKEKRLDITKLSVDSRGKMAMSFRDGFYVKMGLPGEVEKKIAYLKLTLDCKPSLKNETSYLDISCPTAPAYKPKNSM